MRKIFILKGKSETGKTTKINQIAEWIINNYGCANTIGLNTTNYLKDTHGILTVNKLTIGINSSGDNEWEVKKIDNLSLPNDERPDIILCTCRTKGKGRKHIRDNYNRTNGWLSVFIGVEEFPILDIKNQTTRDTRVIEELKTWLTGLEKL
ncbi:hypothetical protein ESY86_20285 [Subsaximicrobium wynnwilliamsii]|jgi:hypothetical protein|uniref:Uncharacterized protein n=1 Tax=Subsaximicrobium wynnwilliamsii TaxID=291179 RepID=A0A5C6ZA56_9FLAO|nr:hypothetical protein [Subsaximicrobium wynnwilliamsii]TXD80701.1 hypothetical protein ESY87_20365 [Subsaximicrobium wynnwilliamsii]TXD86406.1 hypothetical protein ESY86_20285 [Subsaximicrobium wynnwilliamsii]TXD99924.1 hypothetical protein ESY88_20310 [Subsaximicrobium wynnwilliamsii]